MRWVQTAHKKATLPGKGGLRDKVVEGDRPSTLPCQIGGRSFQGVDNSKRRGDGFDPGEESDQVRLSTMNDRSICHAKIAPAPPLVCPKLLHKKKLWNILPTFPESGLLANRGQLQKLHGVDWPTIVKVAHFTIET